MMRWHCFASTSLLFVLGFLCEAQKVCKWQQDKPWSYAGKNGPRHWAKTFPQCKGRNQSPIDIKTARVQTAEGGAIRYFGYGEPVQGEVENNGHAIEVIPHDGVSRGISVGAYVFALQQFHFHFGSFAAGIRKGSEHSIDSRTYAMEMHLVHRSQNNRTAVVAVFFDEGFHDNSNLNSLIEAVNSVRHKDDRVMVRTPISLEAILPRCSSTYFRYDGSLTTPPCSEPVMWFVLRQPVPISTAQMKAFRQQSSTPRDVNMSSQCALENNFRPQQPLNNRKVTLHNGDCV